MRGGWGVSGPARSARRVRTRAFDEGDLCHSGTRRNRLTEDKALQSGPPLSRVNDSIAAHYVLERPKGGEEYPVKPSERSRIHARPRLEPIWPSNKKLSRLKLKTERVELTPEGLLNSLPAHDAQCFLKRNVPAPRRTRTLIYPQLVNQTKIIERPAEGSDSHRVRGCNLIFSVKRREHS